ILLRTKHVLKSSPGKVNSLSRTCCGACPGFIPGACPELVEVFIPHLLRDPSPLRRSAGGLLSRGKARLCDGYRNQACEFKLRSVSGLIYNYLYCPHPSFVVGQESAHVCPIPRGGIFSPHPLQCRTFVLSWVHLPPAFRAPNVHQQGTFTVLNGFLDPSPPSRSPAGVWPVPAHGFLSAAVAQVCIGRTATGR
ncbi:MAG: hypothetical protein ACK2UE_07925, partial [Anaerolineales bacterium]